MYRTIFFVTVHGDDDFLLFVIFPLSSLFHPSTRFLVFLFLTTHNLFIKPLPVRERQAAQRLNQY